MAIKRLFATHDNEKKDLIKILKEEADVLERAKNRHIIQFYCIDEYEGSPVMITDFADMGSLSKVLENNNGQFFVVQEGLQKGDKIIVDGVAGLRDGMSIKPREINSDSLYTQAH